MIVKLVLKLTKTNLLKYNNTSDNTDTNRFISNLMIYTYTYIYIHTKTFNTTHSS